MLDQLNLSYQQALSSEQTEEWKAAITEEYESLMTNKTSEFTPNQLPSDRVSIQSRWLFKITDTDTPMSQKGTIASLIIIR